MEIATVGVGNVVSDLMYLAGATGKFPTTKYNTEENSRMLCVYMRPWCLNIDDVSTHNPFLSKLAIIMIMAAWWHQGTIAPRVLKKNRKRNWAKMLKSKSLFLGHLPWGHGSMRESLEMVTASRM